MKQPRGLRSRASNSEELLKCRQILRAVRLLPFPPGSRGGPCRPPGEGRGTRQDRVGRGAFRPVGEVGRGDHPWPHHRDRRDQRQRRGPWRPHARTGAARRRVESAQGPDRRARTVDKEDVVAIFGGIDTPVSLAIVPVLNKAKCPSWACGRRRPTSRATAPIRTTPSASRRSTPWSTAAAQVRQTKFGAKKPG